MKRYVKRVPNIEPFLPLKNKPYLVMIYYFLWTGYGWNKVEAAESSYSSESPCCFFFFFFFYSPVFSVQEVVFFHSMSFSERCFYLYVCSPGIAFGTISNASLCTCMQYIAKPSPMYNFLWHTWHLKCFPFWCCPPPLQPHGAEASVTPPPGNT